MTATAELSTERLLAAYRTMRTIREFEERLHIEIANAVIPGFVHLYAGEEAVAAGVCAHLTSDDWVSSTHRGHGHAIAKGCDVKAMMAEIYGRATGLCKGKGGSMHIADFRVGMLGANGIVGGGPPLVCGVGLASKISGNGEIGVAFLGDGASNQGTFLESLNLAAAFTLPVVFVVENNGYGETTGQSYAQAIEDVAKRADGFGLPGVSVDGNDFFAVSEAMGAAAARARAGHGPTLLECKTTRYFGHFEGDTQTYRDPNEVASARESRDCLVRFRAVVTEAGIIPGDELDAIDAEVRRLVDDAVAEAVAAPWPDVRELTTDVYIKY